MSVRRKGRPPSWETQATRDLLSDGTTRSIFISGRDAGDLLRSMAAYINDSSAAFDGSSVKILHATSLYYYETSEGSGKIKQHFGAIGGLSEDFLKYAMQMVPKGVRLSRVLMAVHARWQSEAGRSVGSTMPVVLR